MVMHIISMYECLPHIMWDGVNTQVMKERRVLRTSEK